MIMNVYKVINFNNWQLKIKIFRFYLHQLQQKLHSLPKSLLTDMTINNENIQIRIK